VPLSEASLALLASIPSIEGRGEFVFTTTGSSTISGYSKAKKRVDREIETILRERSAQQINAKPLLAWTYHDLRRTAATGMARAGVAQQVIEKVLNHTSGSLAGVAGIYNRHAFTSEKREALVLWSKHILTVTATAVLSSAEQGN
jgi:integrase